MHLLGRIVNDKPTQWFANKWSQTQVKFANNQVINQIGVYFEKNVEICSSESPKATNGGKNKKQCYNLNNHDCDGCHDVLDVKCLQRPMASDGNAHGVHSVKTFS